MKQWLFLLLTGVFAACQQATPPAADFSLSLEPSSVTLPRFEAGQVIRYSLKVTGNLINRPSLRLEQADGSPLPDGLFLNTQPAGEGSAFFLRATETLEPRTYKLRLLGTSGALMRSAELEVKVTNPDFSLGLSANQISIEQGQGTRPGRELTLNLFPTDGFAAKLREAEVRATLSSGDPLPAGLSVFTLPTDDPNRISVAVQASASLTPRSYELKLSVKSAYRQHEIPLTVEVLQLANFNLSTPQTSVQMLERGTLEVPITLMRLEGFNRGVELQVKGYGNNATLMPGITGMFSPNPATGTTATMRLSLDETISGNCNRGCLYFLLVEGVSGSVRKELEMYLTVRSQPNFILSLDRDIEVEQGQIGATFLNIERRNFSTPIDLFLERADGSAAPVGLNLEFSNNPSLDGSTIRVRPTRQVTAGVYNLRVRGVAAGITRTAPLKLTVTDAPDFDINMLSALSAQVGRGYELAVGLPRNSTGGRILVSLTLEREDGSSLPAGLEYYFIYPGPQFYLGTYEDSARLVLRATSRLATGVYRLRVRGGEGMYLHTAPLALTVSQPSSSGTLVNAEVILDAPVNPIAWAAFQDGDGPWQGLAGGSVHSTSFRVTDTRGRYGIALFCVRGITIYQLTLSDTTSPRLGCDYLNLGEYENDAPSAVGSISSGLSTPYVRPTINWTTATGAWQLFTVSATSSSIWRAVISRNWFQGSTAYTFPDLSSTPGWESRWRLGEPGGIQGNYVIGRLNTNRSLRSALIFLIEGVNGLPAGEQGGFTSSQPVTKGTWSP